MDGGHCSLGFWFSGRAGLIPTSLLLRQEQTQEETAAPHFWTQEKLLQR